MKLKIIEQFRRFSPVTCTKNAFGGRDRPGPTGAAIALPQLPSHYKGEGWSEGKERVGNMGEEIVGRERWEGGGRERRGREWGKGR